MILLLIYIIGWCNAELETINQWNFLQFALPYDFPVQDYIPENNIPIGIEVGWKRVFITVPRFRRGVPATLNWIPRSDIFSDVESSPLLQAYPNWDWHRADTNCSGLVSVYRIRMDRCGRLWVLDSGILNILETFTTLCPPKILAFDVQTDRVVEYYEFPRESLRPHSVLTNLEIDHVGDSCSNMFIYMSDTVAPGIVVYDVANQRSWRVTHTTMWPNPEMATYQISGESFTLPDGILGIALSSPTSSQSDVLQPISRQVLYFQPLASDKIFSVPTSALKTPPNPEERENSLPVELSGYKSSQSAALAADARDNYLYFSPVTETAVVAWEPVTNRNRLVAYNPQLLQFVSDLRVADRDNGNMWLLSTKLQKMFRRTYNPAEINFRLIKIRSRDAHYSSYRAYNNSIYI